jgi:hypothetical protein
MVRDGWELAKLAIANREADIITLRTDVNCFSPRWTAQTPIVRMDRNPTAIKEIDAKIYKGTVDGRLIVAAGDEVVYEKKFSDVDINNVTSDEQGDIWVMCLDGKLFRIPRWDFTD